MWPKLRAWFRLRKALPRNRRRYVPLSLECLEDRLAPASASALAAVDPRLALAQLPLAFEANQGQTAPEVNFLAHGQGYTLFLTPGEAVLDGFGTRSVPTTLDLQLVGGNPNAKATGLDLLPGTSNYLIGNQPSNWHTNIANFGQVEYQNVWPGIGVTYYGKQGQLEYDFNVAPGAHPSAIRLAFSGDQELFIDASGNLVISTTGGKVIEQAPVLYQTIHGVRHAVSGGYRLLGNNRVGIAVGAYNPKYALTIDPVLSYSTFLGGSTGGDNANAIALDGQGNIYVAGQTFGSTDFPAQNPFGANTSDTNAFVVKLNAAGTQAVYGDYIGGTTADPPNTGNVFIPGVNQSATGIGVDNLGQVYLTGTTTTSDFPTLHAAQQYVSGSTVGFALALNAAGNQLIYSTYLDAGNAPDGSPANTQPAAIAIDGAGNAYVTGTTGGTGLPTKNPLQAQLNTAPVSASTNAGGGWQSASTGLPQDAVFDIAAAKTQPTTLYLSTTNHGVFKSTDGGGHWAADNGNLTAATLDEARLTVDPGAPSTLYAVVNNTTAHGVFKSSNGGASWAAANTGLPGGQDRVLVDPQSSAVLFIDTSSGVFKSSNGGASWAAANTGLPSGLELAFALDPTSPGTLYVSSVNLGGNQFLFLTTNGGQSWSPVTLPAAVSGSAPAALAVNPSTGAVFAAFSSGSIFVSTNHGQTWTAISQGLPANLSINNLEIDPSNPAVLYLSDSFGNGVFRTGNGGTSWAAVNTGLFDLAVDALAIDPNNDSNVYVGESFFGDNAFVTHFNPNGSLAYSTYLGGQGNLGDDGNGIAIDSNGDAYVTGRASSADFPTLNPLQPTLRGSDNAFVAELNPAGSNLVYSTYLGGSGADRGERVAIDGAGDAYVAGFTTSTDFPLANPVQATNKSNNGGNSAFVTELKAGGGSLVYSTYLGGSGTEFPSGIAVTPAGDAYLTGTTSSVDFPLENAVQGSNHTGPVFKSGDGGATWALENSGLTTGVLSLLTDPSSAATVYANTVVGLFKSTDGGATWAHLVAGLPAGPVGVLALAPSHPATLYLGAPGGVLVSQDGGASWASANGQGTSSLPKQADLLAVDPTDPATVYAVSGGLFKTTDGGGSWAQLHSTALDSALAQQGAGIVGLAIDPNAPSTVYVAVNMIVQTNGGGGPFGISPFATVGDSLLKSTDSGATFAADNSGLPDVGNNSQGIPAGDLQDFSELSVDPHSNAYVLAGGQLQREAAGGSSWAAANNGLTPSVFNYAFDPNVANTLYAATQAGVFKSTDGTHWSLLTGLSPIPLRAVAVAANSAVFVGKDQINTAFVTGLSSGGAGLLLSTYLGGSNSETSSGIALDKRGDVFVDGTTSSTDFPTVHPLQATLKNINGNGFVAEIAAPILTWTGAVDSNWSTPGNWDLNRVPQDGDNLVFPESAANTTNHNDLAAALSTVNSITFTGQEGFLGYSIGTGQITIGAGGISDQASATKAFASDEFVSSSSNQTNLLTFASNAIPISVTDAKVGLIMSSGITGAGSFTKSGPGTLFFERSPVNLQGPCLVSAGTMVVDISITVPSVEVQSGATLSGGARLTGALTVDSGATLEGGGFPVGSGSGNPDLHVTGVVSLSSGSTYEVNTNFAKFLGDTTVAGSAAVTIASGVHLILDVPNNFQTTGVQGQPLPATQTILSAGAAGLSGTFAGDPDGTVITQNGQKFRINYVQGANGHVDLTYLGPTSNLPAPALTSLNPSSTPFGVAFTLTVNGSNFVNGAVVKANGTALTTTFVSAVKLTASVPASAIANPGNVPITVTNPDGQTSNTLNLTATASPETLTWSGAVGAKWSTPGNWNLSGGRHRAPINGDDLVFPANAANLANTDDLVSLSLHSLLFSGNFTTATGGYTIGGNDLTIGAGGISDNGTIGNILTGIVNQIDFNMVLGTAQTWSINDNNHFHKLVIGGSVDNKGFGLTAAGNGEMSVTGRHGSCPRIALIPGALEVLCGWR